MMLTSVLSSDKPTDLRKTEYKCFCALPEKLYPHKKVNVTIESGPTNS